MASSQQVKPQDPTPAASNKAILGYSLALLAHFMFCTSNYFMKKAQETIPLRQIQSYHFLLISAYCYIIASYKKYPFHFKSAKANKLLIIRSVLGMINTYLVFYAFKLLPVSEVTVIGTLGPFIGAALSHVFMGESFERVIVVNGITGIIGVMFIAKPEFIFGAVEIEDASPDRPLGIALCLITCFLGSVIQLFIKRCGALTHPISMVYYFGIITSIIFPISLLFEPAQVITLYDLGKLLLCSSTGTAGLMLLSVALQYGEAGKIGLLGYTQIIFAFFYEIVLDDRTPDKLSLIGTAIILLGFLLLVSKALKKPQQATQPLLDAKAANAIKA